jgi:hypothetical protein
LADIGRDALQQFLRRCVHLVHVIPLRSSMSARSHCALRAPSVSNR